MLAAEPELEQRFGASVEIARQPHAIIDRLETYRQAGALPPNVIVQIGDNGPVRAADTERLRAALQGVAHVVLVNIRDPIVSRQTEVDRVLAQSAKNWPQAAIADWLSVSGDPALTFDGVHPNSAGAAVYADVVAQAFAKLLARPSPPPVTVQPTISSPTSTQTHTSRPSSSSISTIAAGGATPVRATMIGDSVSASILETPSAAQILKRGINIRLELRVCRRLIAPSCPYQGQTPPTALDTLESLGSGLGSVLVMDVGYNDDSDAFVSGIDRVMQFALAHGVHSVVWVNLRVTGGYASTYTAINDALEQASHHWPELHVADWNRYSAGKSWFASDGLHMGASGADALAAFLRPYILGQNP
jgi:lysophospholipase L1-like esterase